MQLSNLEAAALRDHYLAGRNCTPEELASRLGVTLGEVREAEKTLLRKIAPDADPADARPSDLTGLEAAVLRDCVGRGTPSTPESVAAELDVTVGEVFEAIKTGMAKLEAPGHASAESLDALGLPAGGDPEVTPPAGHAR